MFLQGHAASRDPIRLQWVRAIFKLVQVGNELYQGIDNGSNTTMVKWGWPFLIRMQLFEMTVCVGFFQSVPLTAACTSPLVEIGTECELPSCFSSQLSPSSELGELK